MTGKPSDGDGGVKLNTETLTGDIRDAILREFKAADAPWPKMTEAQQERLIRRADDIAGKLVRESVHLVGSRGLPHFQITLGNIAIKDAGIEAKISASYDKALVDGLCERRGRTLILVARDIDAFRGQQAPAKPENVGDLAMPKDRADKANLEQIGRGKGGNGKPPKADLTAPDVSQQPFRPALDEQPEPPQAA